MAVPWSCADSAAVGRWLRGAGHIPDGVPRSTSRRPARPGNWCARLRTAHDAHLVNRRIHQDWLTRWQYSAHCEYLVTLVILVGLSGIPVIIALIQ